MEQEGRQNRSTEARAVVSWEGAGQPIMLTIYDSDGKATSVPLRPVRALELARERQSVLALGPASL